MRGWPGGPLREWPDAERAGLAVLAGRPLHWWQRLGGLTVVASDIDADAGVAAVWLARWPGTRRAVEETLEFEWIDGGWRYLGGGSGSGQEERFSAADRPSGARAGPASMMTCGGSTSVRSLKKRQEQRTAGAATGAAGPASVAEAGWVACAQFRVAAEIETLQIGERRISVPAHGYVLAVWKAPPSLDIPSRPRIEALRRDGSAVTRFEPGAHLDSLSLAAIDEE